MRVDGGGNTGYQHDDSASHHDTTGGGQGQSDKYVSVEDAKATQTESKEEDTEFMGSLASGFNSLFGDSTKDSSKDKGYGFSEAFGDLADGEVSKAFGSFGDAFGNLGDASVNKVESFFSGDSTAKDTRAGYEKTWDSIMDTIGFGDEGSKASFSARAKREVDDFTKAPLDYAADLIDNPFISTGLAFTGLGLTAFGVKALDAVTDLAQGESTYKDAAFSMAGSAVSSTPIGKVLGPFRGIAGAALSKPDEAGRLFAKGVSGKLGATLGSTLVGSLARNMNPITRMMMASAGGMLASKEAQKFVDDELARSPKEHREAIRKPANRQSSLTASTDYKAPSVKATVEPLESSGALARRSTKALMQPTYTGLYSDTINQLNSTGLNLNQSYGLS